MASQFDSYRVVSEFSTACVSSRDYAYALGYVGAELVDAIELLSPAKREKFLEMLTKRTESLNNS